jgi:riboflavin synthase
VFTGIVEELGEVVAVEAREDSAVLTLAASRIAEDLTHGASIAVNGVCLTVIGWRASDRTEIDFDVMGETLRRSVIGDLKPGDQVNLERAARVDARLDGHIVQGHVDGSGSVVSRTPGDAWESVRFALPPELSRYVAEKGSVAVDGVSLTVSGVGDDWFEVGLIPETLRATTLGAKSPGSRVNLEVDVLAKYVERLLERGASQA